jgi:hypothetical protein
MLIKDVALIYKKKQGYYYAISRQRGKIIFDYRYFHFGESGSHAYCFVEYEYLTQDYDRMVHQNKVILKIQDMALLSLLSYRSSWYQLMFILNFFFDYFLEYTDPVDFFSDFYLFFSLNEIEKSALIGFVFSLLKKIQILSEDEIQYEGDISDLVKKKYIERAPFLKNYIESLFIRFFL